MADFKELLTDFENLARDNKTKDTLEKSVQLFE